MKSSNRKFLYSILITLFLFVLSGCATSKIKVGEKSNSSRNNYSLTDDVSISIKERLQDPQFNGKIIIGEEAVQLSEYLPLLYELQHYQPLWIRNTTILPQAIAFFTILKEVENADSHSSAHHIDEINNYYQKIKNSNDSIDPNTLANFDLLISDSLINYLSNLINGRNDTIDVDLSWLKNHSNVDYSKILTLDIDSNQLENSFENQSYVRLRKALIKYKIIEANGGWPNIPPGTNIEKGYQGERISLIRKRLTITGDLNGALSDDRDLYDDILENAVRKFQRRHGLTEDGIVGPATLEAFNTPAEKRVNQMIINMERFRLLPKNLGYRNIQVNIPAFKLDVVQNGNTVMTMPVVVGKQYWNTPLFSANMTYLVFNPYWNIPKSIALEETIPKIKEDAEYLSKQNLKVLQGWSNKPNEIEPTTLDWEKINENNYKIRLRQDPGPLNPLGQIKFVLPNSNNVYLHDTPLKDLFKRSKRDFSHGCIRVQNPIGLAEYVLFFNTGWSRDKILSEIDKGQTQFIRLHNPIPIYFFYFTAWVDEDGIVNFRKDIYERDAALRRSIRKVS